MPKKTITPDKEKKDINDKLLALLLSDDYAQINLGLELANSISDYDIFNYLLQGVQIFNNLPVTNSIFLGNNRNKDFRAYALEGLLCIAPKEIEIAQRYRNGIIDLNIQGFHITSLLTISGMENLSSLIIQSTKISVLSDTNKLQKLEKLIISNNSDLKDLSGLKELKKLKSIEISNCGITDLNNLADLINLVELKITSCQNLTTTNGMINLPALERIKLDSNLALENIDSLGNMSKLIDISLNDCPGINNIKSLVNLPVLKVLRLNRHNLKSSDDISQLMKPLTEGLRK
jgi:Leucine-rich repeat (LRR) protein